MSGIAAKVRAGAWLALGALVALYLGVFRGTEDQGPVITPPLIPVAPIVQVEAASDVIAVDVTLKATE